jgi:hypothetical protein
MASHSFSTQKPLDQRYAIFVVLRMFDNRSDVLGVKVARQLVRRILAVFFKKGNPPIHWQTLYEVVFPEAQRILLGKESSPRRY